MGQSKLPSFLLATWLLGTIAAKSRIDDFLQSLHRYEIVHPRIIPQGSPRGRRSTRQEKIPEDREEPLFIEISNWTLRTTINDRVMLSSNFTVEWISREQNKSLGYDAGANCNLRRGTLEETGSFVVLTVCREEIYAVMLFNEKSLVVQPLHDGRHVLYESEGKRRWKSSRDEETVSVTRQEETGTPAGNRGRRRNRGDDNRETQPAGRRRRESKSVQYGEYYNLSGDVFDMDYPESERLVLYEDKEESDFGQDDPDVGELPFDVDPVSTGYFSDPTWQRSKLAKIKILKGSSLRWLELGVAADYTVTDFHGSRVEQYILALLNIVGAIYMDPSLQSNMILVIVRMVLYAEKGDGVVRRGDARRSLENVNKWNRRMLSHTDISHDVAVWLTRLDIGGPSGYAPVSGVCNPARSCALNRDEGLTSAFIIAHEVAHMFTVREPCRVTLALHAGAHYVKPLENISHSLGLTHDGDESTGNVCAEEASRGSVMAPMVAATFHHFYWSICSRKEFHRRVRRWTCLLNRPNEDNFSRSRATVLETFTMDEQCRMEFGEGYELCKTFVVTEPCSLLWCGNINISQTCKTKKGPPLDGTLCGDSKWCINGRCEYTDDKRFDLGVALNKPRDGGWGAWSPWEKCSRSCGVGVQCRSRKCNKPAPAYGGKYCSGSNDDCKLCELSKCTTPVDLRAQQCSKLNGSPYVERLLKKRDTTWLPYAPDQESLKCQLLCRAKETGEVFLTRKSLADGTPCTYGRTDICIQGECRRMGCDNVLGSKKAFDKCGVCDGDDSNCDTVANKFQRKLRREMTRVAVIPREAHNLFMNITIPRLLSSRENLSVAIGDGRRRRNVVENFISHSRRVVIVHGAAFRIQRINNHTFSVNANGSAFDDVAVLLVTPRKLTKQGITAVITVQYYINRQKMSVKARYVWMFGGWSFCSASCGGGTRQKTAVCKDEKTGRIVSRRKCSLITKPAQEIEKCNVFSCEFKWLPSTWEGCSATCGSFGVQVRQLYCVQADFNGTELNKRNELEVYQTMVQPSVCKNSSKPASSRECNRVPCPGIWIYTDWSSCSKGQGKGVQSRIARCVAPEKEALFSCEGASVRTEIRPCNGHVTRAIEFPYSCWKDKSRFCSLPSLKRYCGVHGFRSKCCRSCELDGT